MCRFSDAGNDEAGHTRGYGDLAQGSAPVGRHSDIILCAYETFELESFEGDSAAAPIIDALAGAEYPAAVTAYFEPLRKKGAPPTPAPIPPGT